MIERRSSFSDAVAKPLNSGELLARLRAGTRFLQFERRQREQSLCDHCTGLLSRSGLLQTLESSHDASHSGTPECVHLVLMSLDLFDNVSRCIGAGLRDQLLCDVADMLEELAGEQAWIARIRSDAFALALLNSSLEQAEQLAEDIRKNVAHREFQVSGNAVQLTATLCVDTLNGSTTGLQQPLAEAERNLQYAETLGGSTVCRSGQFDDQYADWIERHIRSGAAQSQLTAQDIMTPFTAILQESNLRDDYLDAIRASDVAVAPYTDLRGRYLGILREAAWAEATRMSFDTQLETPPEVNDQTSWAELIEHFTEQQEELLVVLRDQKPLGYISCHKMAEIVAPVDV